MRGPFPVAPLLLAVLVSLPLSAGEVFLSIGGSVNNFRTDARILNPSGTKDITLQAWLLPVGNQSNAGVQPVTLTIPKRQMRVLDDIVASLFNATGIGAVRLRSDDDFVATQRIYAVTSTGTLGQFVPGLEKSAARAKGVLLQLEASNAFRTNIGAVNPNAVAATVTWSLYDRSNQLVATGSPVVMPPFAVIGPTSMASGFFFDAAGKDLSDAWVSYASDQPIFAYGSVVDQATTDPTFIPASEDTGEPVPAPPQAKTIALTARSFEYDASPGFDLAVGDQVRLMITAEDTTHGFTLIAPDGSVVIPPLSIPPNRAAVEQTFTVTQAGQWRFFCTHVCGTGHFDMSGSFMVPAAGKQGH